MSDQTETPADANTDPTTDAPSMDAISLDQIDDLLAASAERILQQFGADAQEYTREAAVVVNNIVAGFAANPSGDIEYAIEHGKARLFQLASIHLTNIEIRTKRAIIDVTLTVVRSLIAVLAPVA